MEKEFFERVTDACEQANEISVAIDKQVEQMNLKNQASVMIEMVVGFQLIYKMLTVIVAEMKRKRIASAGRIAKLQMEVNAINAFATEMKQQAKLSLQNGITLELRKREIEKNCNYVRKTVLNIMGILEKYAGLE